MDVWGVLLSGGVAVAAIKLIDNLALFALNRRAKKKDDNKQTMEQKVDGLIGAFDKLNEAQIASMEDRISYLGQRYISAGDIEIGDRERLIRMHKAYHDLGGNGNLDLLMKEVNKLPLKKIRD